MSDPETAHELGALELEDDSGTAPLDSGLTSLPNA